MDIADLKVFEAVVRLGSMSRAAEELHTVQSNVTARIQNLETALSLPLFHRHSRGVRPTPAADRLLPYAAQAIRLVEDARRAAAGDGAPSGRLVVGSLETTAALRLAPLLSDYAAAWPEVDLTLRTGTTAEMTEAVLDHRVEGAFVCGPVSHPELVTTEIFREELMVATARSIPSLDEFLSRGAPRLVVLRAGCSYRQRLEAVLAKRGVAGLRLLEFGTIDALTACVAAGVGVTLLPRGILDSTPSTAGIRAPRPAAGGSVGRDIVHPPQGTRRCRARSRPCSMPPGAQSLTPRRPELPLRSLVSPRAIAGIGYFRFSREPSLHRFGIRMTSARTGRA